MSSSSRAHRPEIDGLRALAVLPVMFFHAGWHSFGGGFVGVDVFFVISGFLITSIILDERLAGRFSIVRFYERRARRILPALLFMMLLCLPAAYLLMAPQELAAFGRSLVAVSVFVSNVLFWRTTGYFDLAAEEKPLLHTWSLGVEEQYYVFFPLLMALGWRLGLRRLAIGLAALALLSLAGAEWALRCGQAAASFFLVPTRAWELFVGSLLAFSFLKGNPGGVLSRPSREGLAVLGLALILLPVALYDAATPFPGLYALPPVTGTLLAIVFATPDTAVGRLLTLRFVLWVGTISYSAYLWHQPLFAFARLYSPDKPAAWVLGALIVLALAMAHLSWKYVETPFRQPGRWSRRGIFTVTSLGSLLFMAIGAVWVVNGGWPERFEAAQRAFVEPPASSIKGCPAAGSGLHLCPLGSTAPGARPQVALLGDSHAYAIATAFDEALKQRGVAGVLLHTDCHPIPGLFDSREALTAQRIAHCRGADERVDAHLAGQGIDKIIVAVRWTARLYPMGQSIDAPAFDNGEGGIESDYPYRRNLTLQADGRATDAADGKHQAVGQYLARLQRHGQVAVLYPVPEVGWSPARINIHSILVSGRPASEVSTSWQRMRERNAAAQAVLDGVSGPLVRVRPEERLCNTSIPQRCAVQVQGQLHYADDDHLSSGTARLVVEDLLNGLGLPARP